MCDITKCTGFSSALQPVTQNKVSPLGVGKSIFNIWSSKELLLIYLKVVISCHSYNSRLNAEYHTAMYLVFLG